MTSTSWFLLGTAAVFAVGDWVAVARRIKPLEYVCKPAVMVALIGVALSLDAGSIALGAGGVPVPEASLAEDQLIDPNDSQRWWFVAALAMSLAGDVFLMIPRDRFVAGLGSFLVAHLAYTVGMHLERDSLAALVAGVVAVAVALSAVAPRILRSVQEDHPKLLTPVTFYVAVIAVMVASAIGTLDPWAATGALLFMASDTLIAWNRFVQPRGWAPLTIIVTYHGGQALLVLSLLY